MDGSIGKSSQSALILLKIYQKILQFLSQCGMNVFLVKEAFKITKELGTNVTNRVKKLDKNAAAFILQGAIDYLSN